MKINIVFEINNTRDVDDIIEEFTKLQHLHIKTTMCKKPDTCSEISNLAWIIIQLENVVKQQQKSVWEYKQEVKE